MGLTIASPAFEHTTSIPDRYTCDGADVSPPLSWQGIPEGTKSLALIVDDPDAPDPAAPKVTWVHWVLYNLPPEVTALPEGGYRLRYRGIAGRGCRLLRSPDLKQWDSVWEAVVPAHGLVEWFEPGPPAAGAYYLAVQP